MYQKFQDFQPLEKFHVSNDDFVSRRYSQKFLFSLQNSSSGSIELCRGPFPCSFFPRSPSTWSSVRVPERVPEPYFFWLPWVATRSFLFVVWLAGPAERADGLGAVLRGRRAGRRLPPQVPQPAGQPQRRPFHGLAAHHQLGLLLPRRRRRPAQPLRQVNAKKNKKHERESETDRPTVLLARNRVRRNPFFCVCVFVPGCNKKQIGKTAFCGRFEAVCPSVRPLCRRRFVLSLRFFSSFVSLSLRSFRSLCVP